MYSTQVSEYPIVTDERGEVWCLETVHDVEKLGTVDGVNGRETAARKYTQLQHCSDCWMLRRLCTQTNELSKISEQLHSCCGGHLRRRVLLLLVQVCGAVCRRTTCDETLATDYSGNSRKHFRLNVNWLHCTVTAVSHVATELFLLTYRAQKSSWMTFSLILQTNIMTHSHSTNHPNGIISITYN